ncbi:hypothetical protein [Micromonospora echinaurantiaca]|uniref:hypothetical protein n=1 Tax=Micromonospora echinaurantiaca TaxID=47857 RepID=UPI003417A3D5
MAKPVKRSGWRPAGARNPKAYALSVAGAVLVLLGLVVVDSVLLVGVGAALAVAGWLVARRSG